MIGEEDVDVGIVEDDQPDLVFDELVLHILVEHVSVAAILTVYCLTSS